jgi:hypothetical protein
MLRRVVFECMRFVPFRLPFVNASADELWIDLRQRASLDDIMTPPLLPRGRTLDKREIASELDNNAQVRGARAVRL